MKFRLVKSSQIYRLLHATNSLKVRTLGLKKNLQVIPLPMYIKINILNVLLRIFPFTKHNIVKIVL